MSHALMIFRYGSKEVTLYMIKFVERTRHSICSLVPCFTSKRHICAKPKDPVTKEQLTDAIYSIPSNDSDNEYIGQTKRQFGTRLKEHQRAVFFCEKENSALSEHTCLTNHTLGWNKYKIITANWRYHQRLCLEAWHNNSAIRIFILKLLFEFMRSIFGQKIEEIGVQVQTKHCSESFRLVTM